MKNPIQITSMMLFSIGYFVMGVLNLFHINPDATYGFFDFLDKYHLFESSLIIGAVFSVIQNYNRAKTGKSKILYNTIFLFGWDYAIMLLGVLASHLVLLSFTYSKDSNLHLTVGIFGGVVIGINFCRKQLMNYLSQLLVLFHLRLE